MSYADLIVSRPYRKAAHVSEEMLEEAEVGRGVGGPVAFAALLAGAQLTDELRAKGLKVLVATETTAVIPHPLGGLKVGVELWANGLLPEERLPSRRRRS